MSCHYRSLSLSLLLDVLLLKKKTHVNTLQSNIFNNHRTEQIGTVTTEKAPTMVGVRQQKIRSVAGSAQAWAVWVGAREQVRRKQVTCDPLLLLLLSTAAGIENILELRHL